MATKKNSRTRRHAATEQGGVDGNDPSAAPSEGFDAAFRDEKHSTSKGVNAKDGAVAPNDARFQANDDELWSFKTVIAKTGLSRSSIYGYVARGIFPRQRRLGPRRVAWLASDVRAWIDSRPF
jgi:predicted DNA-binding transcriptional regulator AlpA